MIVSLVGRTMSGSSSLAEGAGCNYSPIELQAIGNRGQYLGDLDELLNAATENGREQEAILGHLQLRHDFG